VAIWTIGVADNLLLAAINIGSSNVAGLLSEEGFRLERIL
jgi:hypothetical protein